MKILIAGLAKTGTTGLLYLIANSFGKKPKLLFEPKECPANLNAGSNDVIAKVLIASNLNATSFAHFDKKITIVRDPRDRIVSLLLYNQFSETYLTDAERVRAVFECLVRKESDPSRMSIREVLEFIADVSGRKVNIFAKHLESIRQQYSWLGEYVATTPDTLLYKYEDFVSGVYVPLEKHLGMQITGAAEVPEKLNRVTRTKGFGDWRNWFTVDDVQKYRPSLTPWLEKYGYDADDWTLNAEPSITPEHCSKYFMRLVEERRWVQSRSLKGIILRADQKVVSGWVIGADPNHPIRVALLINGNEVAQAVADKSRPGIKEKGIHPSGMCGFDFRFEPGKALKIGDQVTVKPIGFDFIIKNSPCLVSATTVNTR